MSITCKQAVDYISKKEEGKLSPLQKIQLWRHLAICSLCRIFSEQNKLFAKIAGKSILEKKVLSENDKEIIIDEVLGSSRND